MNVWVVDVVRAWLYKLNLQGANMPYADKASRAASASMQRTDNGQAAALEDRSSRGQVLRQLADLSRSGPAVTAQRKVLAQLFGAGVIQAKRVSIAQMRSLGFTGPHDGGSWQWNGPGGIHVTAVRADGHVTHFHVRRDTRGGVYNRIDFNEVDGAWVEGAVHVPAGADLEGDMRRVGQETIALFNGLIEPT